ncbi:MAG: hypothetical protein ACRC10_01145 [Thermoguttaceae bacterium]
MSNIMFGDREFLHNTGFNQVDVLVKTAKSLYSGPVPVLSPVFFRFVALFWCPFFHFLLYAESGFVHLCSPQSSADWKFRASDRTVVS